MRHEETMTRFHFSSIIIAATRGKLASNFSLKIPCMKIYTAIECLSNHFNNFSSNEAWGCLATLRMIKFRLKKNRILTNNSCGHFFIRMVTSFSPKGVYTRQNSHYCHENLSMCNVRFHHVWWIISVLSQHFQELSQKICLYEGMLTVAW